MRRVWKYKLELTNTQTVNMLLPARILCVDFMDGQLYAWAIVDPEQKPVGYEEPVTLEIYGTGHRFTELALGDFRTYIGSAYERKSGLVVHVFRLDVIERDDDKDQIDD